MPNGDNTGGPNLRGPRGVIVAMILVLFAYLLFVFNQVSGGALWQW